MIVFAFFAMYVTCAALLLAVVWQNRNRAAGRPDACDPRTTHVSEFVFRTQA